jgi:hypothetical protein
MSATFERRRFECEAATERIRIAGAGIALLLVLSFPAVGVAAPPLEPLPAPYYCFDEESPSVLEGFVRPMDVLRFAQPHPEVAIDGCLLGLCDPDDSLAGLSGPHSEILPDQTFVIMFSVDRETVGLAGPDPELIALDVPYSPQDQAWRGQAAGDQFISNSLFTLAGGVVPHGRPRSYTGTLNRNNFDEGGTEFVAVPATSASTPPVTDPEDEVSSTSYLPTTTRREVMVYFTASPNSPSLTVLAGSIASGADVFFNPDPLGGDGTVLYASFYELGLQQPDSIDAFMAFDVNGNGIYDAPDSVLFSLAPGSPSLTQLPGHSQDGAAADIFIAQPDFETRIFANADLLGLGAPSDNIDAIELYLCDDALQLAAQSGIRALRGDLNCDDVINGYDIDPFVLALTDPLGYEMVFPGCHLWRADVNRDGVVNGYDIDPFVLVLVGGH